MKDNLEHYKKLGYCDCVADFCVTDGGPKGSPWIARVTFDAFEVLNVEDVGSGKTPTPDFMLEGSLETWRAMIESISDGDGRPALDQTINYLSHFHAPMNVTSDDPLRRDLFYRYNQSLQSFISGSSAFDTVFS